MRALCGAPPKLRQLSSSPFIPHLPICCNLTKLLCFKVELWREAHVGLGEELVRRAAPRGNPPSTTVALSSALCC